MAKAAVMYDARAILKHVSVLKQQRLRTGTAAHAARGRVGFGLLCRTRPTWWVRRGLKSWVWLGVSACACGDPAVNNFL